MASPAPEVRGVLRAYAAPLLLVAGLLYLYAFHARPAMEDLAKVRAWQDSVREEMAALEAEEAGLRSRLAAANGDPLYRERLLQAQFGRTLFPEEEALRKAENAKGDPSRAAKNRPERP